MARLLCACFHTSQDTEVIPLPWTVEESAIHQLPADAISRISQFLEVTDVLSLTHTCSFLYSCVTQDNRLWKRHCQHHFKVDALPTGGRGSWYTQWLHLCREFGRYRFCYAQVKSAWKQIESFLQHHSPQTFRDLMSSGGASEAELDMLEARLQMWLPNDYRCSLKLHGKLPVSLGSVNYLVHHDYSEETEVKTQTFNLKAVSDIQVVRARTSPEIPEAYVKFVGIAENIYSLPTYGNRSYGVPTVETSRELLVMICDIDAVMRTRCPLGYVITGFPSALEYTSREVHDCGPNDVGCIADRERLYKWFDSPESSTFADWLSAEAHRLQHYYINQQRQLTRFILKPWSEAVTGHFTAHVATAVLNKTPGMYLRDSTYRCALCVVLKLSINAPTEESYLLHKECLLFLGAQATPHCCSLVQKPPLQTFLHPGGVIEYVSEPVTLTEDVSCIQGGYVVMRTDQGRRQIRVNLPQMSFETVSTVNLVNPRLDRKLLRLTGHAPSYMLCRWKRNRHSGST